MFLERIRRRNPKLLRAAAVLHQSGSIPANSWVIDLDVIAENAVILAESARANGLKTYVMTKQHGRNPFVTRIAMDRGLGAPVAVDIQCVKILHRYGIKPGHIGHLNQIPKHEMMDAVKMQPEVFTVFSFEMAQAVSEAAARLGRVQAIMLRIVGKDDVFFEGQEGGIPEGDLEETARRIGTLRNVEIIGTVSFPCIRYNPTPDIKVEPTPNMGTIVRAAERLRKMGFAITQINAPGNTSSRTFEIIAKAGGTHAEPGHGLLGTTPNHAFLEGQPERPSYVYISEISHYVGDMAYCYGGGFWQDIYNPSFVPRALVGSDPETISDRLVNAVSKRQIIDYHGILQAKEGVKIGDTVIFGFRTQMQMTRSQVAVVQGVQSGKPQVVGLFDHAGTMIDRDRIPVAITDAQRTIESVAKTYKTQR
jgi:predicted amino acid racemase